MFQQTSERYVKATCGMAWGNKLDLLHADLCQATVTFFR